jgi:hypothetical protein
MKPTTRKPKKQDNPEFQNFGAFVKYHFGTKSEFAKQMGVSRPIAHKWFDNPGAMTVNTLKKIYDLTKDNGGDLTDLSELCLASEVKGVGDE